MSESENEEKRGMGPLQVAKSIFWAGLGVQSNANRERDFKQGKMLHFIIGGLIGTVAFMLIVWLWVRAMLPES